jgi:hypothetical protein
MTSFDEQSVQCHWGVGAVFQLAQTWQKYAVSEGVPQVHFPG